MFKPKLSQPLSVACIAALMAFAASRPALAFVQNPEKPAGGFLVPTGLDVYTSNFLRSKIRVDTRYPEWRDLFYIYTLGQTYIDALKWNGNIVTGCGGNEFQMEVAYLPAGVGDAETATPELYKLWQKVRWEYQD